jgi:outer membrane protein W
MRKLGIVVAAIACLMVSTVTFAADAPAAGRMMFGVNGGLVVPTGDYGDLFGMGFQGGIYGDYLVTPQFALGVDAGYVNTPVKSEFKVEGVDIKYSIIPIIVHAKWLPEMKGNVAPYVVVGGGYYMMTATMAAELEGVKVSVSADENKPGFMGGAGVDFKVNPQVKLGLFANVHDILTEGTSLMYFNAGVNVGFMVGGK